MEYMENTFKIRKKTKRDTILHKAKVPKGEGLLPGQIRAKHIEKKGPKTNQTISKWRELYRHGPHIPRGPPDKTCAKMASFGDDRPMGEPNPL